GSVPTCASSGVNPRTSGQLSTSMMAASFLEDDPSLACDGDTSGGACLWARDELEPPLGLRWLTDRDRPTIETSPHRAQKIPRSRRHNPKVRPTVPLRPNRVAIAIVPPS